MEKSTDPADSKDNSQSMSDDDFKRLAKSLQVDTGAHVNVPFVAGAGVILALCALSFIYEWPLWSSLLFVVLLGVLTAATIAKRPPVAPQELTARERERVERVLKEHGVRAAVALVRALYPEGSSASANRTVKIVMERMLAAKKRER